jgi:hypothetical protein
VGVSSDGHPSSSGPPFRVCVSAFIYVQQFSVNFHIYFRLFAAVIRIDPAWLSGRENFGMAVGIALLLCTQTNMYIIHHIV